MMTSYPGSEQYIRFCGWKFFWILVYNTSL